VKFNVVTVTRPRGVHEVPGILSAGSL